MIKSFNLTWFNKIKFSIIDFNKSIIGDFIAPITPHKFEELLYENGDSVLFDNNNEILV